QKIFRFPYMKKLHEARPCRTLFTARKHGGAISCYKLSMETTNAFYINKIKEDLSLKQRMNPQYSLRAYAKHLGVHSSTLSQILNGKRALPLKNATTVASKLNLGPKERTLFIESLYKLKTSLDDIKIDQNDDRFMLDESYAKVIAEWEHYAVITLFDVDGFSADIVEISGRLAITKNRAEVVLNNLLTCGLVKISADGKLEKAHPKIRTTEDVTSKALKDSHIETLEMGKNKLEEIEVEFRDFSAMTIAMDLERMPEVKTIIREFRQKLSALLRDGEKKDVCQLAIQFYPLTNFKKH
ncbi:MAG: TIGR02147 family protein, partial [Bacteriovorax sp.]|nr:TIGR02147 family protein [Bacteriovorax sp.]